MFNFLFDKELLINMLTNQTRLKFMNTCLDKGGKTSSEMYRYFIGKNSFYCNIFNIKFLSI